MRRKFFGSARALPSRKNYSPLATRCRFWLGRSLALPFHSALILRPTLRSVFVPCPMSPAPLKLMSAENFSAAQERCPPEKNYSPLATRCRFWLGRSLALPSHPPTEVGGYENEAY